MCRKRPLIVHVHTDTKFLFQTSKYFGEDFRNIIILLDTRDGVENINEEVLYFSSKKKDLLKATEICNQSDLVVLYGLGPCKIFISQKIEDGIKIAWRFFGAELYKIHWEKYMTALTSHYIHRDRGIHFSRLPNRVLQSLKWRTVKRHLLQYKLHQAIERCDYVFMLMSEEYDLLKKDFHHLPKLIELPESLSSIDYEHLDAKNKRHQIIVGNNKSHFNNHLDVVQIIKKAGEGKGVNFIFPLSYHTSDPRYFKELSKQLDCLNQVTKLESFIPYTDYRKMIAQSKALVHNAIRQMGAGNIKLALRSGVKVYLNPKSILFKNLLNCGYYIFSVDDLESDLIEDNIALSQAEIQHNVDTHLKIKAENSKEKFREKIRKELASC